VGTVPELFGVDDEGRGLAAERVPHYRGRRRTGLRRGGRLRRTG